MTALEKLVQIASDPLSEQATVMSKNLLHQAGSRARELEDLLTLRNGFLSFEGALHVFPSTAAAGDYTLEDWNAPDVWREAYGHLAKDGLFFAEDIFGNQFVLLHSKICVFDAETAETRPIADGLEGWAAAILGDYELLTGYPLAHEWQLRNGPVLVGQRLVPRKPFVLGGGYDVENLRAVPAIRGMCWRGGIAQRLIDLPDGETLTIKPMP